MKTTMESIKDMVDVNTIVGDAVETADGIIIIPISKVSFGFASGGGDYTANNSTDDKKVQDNKQITEKTLPFVGGAGAGVSVQPVAFMVVGNDNIKLMPVDQKANMIDNLISTTPKVIDSIQNMLNKTKKKDAQDHIINYD